MKARTIFNIFIALSLLLTACGNKNRQPAIPDQDMIPVKLLPVNQVGGDGQIEATGIFTTDDETILGFKNGGVIDRIYVREGEPIRKGQRLASVQSGDLDSKSGQARVALEKAERDYQRAQRLYKDSVATLEQMQNAKSALDIAREDVNAVDYNQDHLNIYAPVSGFVLARLANEGQVVGAGTPVLQVNGAGRGQWTLKVGVSDGQWAAIKVGDEAQIATDALPGQQLSARVSRKSEALDPNSGTFTIYLDLTAAPQGRLASGVFGKATILTPANASQHSWRVPYAALVDAQGKEAFLFVTKDNKTAVKQKVSLGEIQKDWVTITGGLENVSAIVVSGSAYLIDGSNIVIQN